MKIKKNDVVRVLSGDLKGKTGKVMKIFPKKKKIQIENIGFYKKHIKSRIYRKYPKGGIIEKPKLIDVSNVMIFSESLNRPVRIGYVIDTQNRKCRVLRGRNVPYKIIN